MPNRSSCDCSSPGSRLRSASNTRSRPMTVSPWTFFRSLLTVSAMPDPIHSSAGSRVMLANVITAIEFSGATAATICPLPLPLRRATPEPCRSRLFDARPHALQVVVEIARRLVAQVRVLLERLSDDALDLRRHGIVQARERGRRLMEQGVHDLAERLALERQPRRRASRRARRRREKRSDR